MALFVGKFNAAGRRRCPPYVHRTSFASHCGGDGSKDRISFDSRLKSIPRMLHLPSRTCQVKKFASRRNLSLFSDRKVLFFTQKRVNAKSKTGNSCRNGSPLQIRNTLLETSEKTKHSVEICKTDTLAPVNSLQEAISSVCMELERLKADPLLSSSGVLRLQVPLPSGMTSLNWLRAQPEKNVFYPKMYFSTRMPRGSLASGVDTDSEIGLVKYSGTESGLDGSGIGSVSTLGSSISFQSKDPFVFEDWKEIRRYLSENSPLVRAYGGLRFDQSTRPSTEWENFGAFYFNIPQVEFRECENFNLFSCNLVWDLEKNMTFHSSIENILGILMEVIPWSSTNEAKIMNEIQSLHHCPNESEWEKNFEKVLKILSQNEVDPLFDAENSNDSNSLHKVVLARKTSIELSKKINPLDLLTILKNEDSSAYQFFIQLPSGECFLGNTPERLFIRKHNFVASEAVASTRSRGKTDYLDFLSSVDLILSVKDHNEFEIVRMSIEKNMQSVCKIVEVEEGKKIIKQAKIQHLYSRINGILNEERGEYDLLTLLHPTPAVSGQPKNLSMAFIRQIENFDRGFYAGPLGWIGGDGCEFCVAIRSAFIPAVDCSVKNSKQNKNPENGSSINAHQESLNQLILYAGVGIVNGANFSDEWNELNLKISQFKSIISSQEQILNSPNINFLWCNLLVEECTRLGLRYFCIAPGSRSSPLAIAAMSNQRAKCVICYDERSLAFHALGYGKGSSLPAIVITSSGTAISNLLPAVVESSMDCIPLILFTADRPHELRDTGANQTIPQANHYGDYVRYHFDLPTPDSSLPAKMILSTIDQAVYRACSEPAGPIHINFPFREPLAPSPSEYNEACLIGLSNWLSSSSPFTSYINAYNLIGPGPFLYPPSQNNDRFYEFDFFNHGNLLDVAQILCNAQKGMIVVGGLQRVEESWAAMDLARLLQWPIVADITSGLRILTPGSMEDASLTVLHYFDHVLLCEDAHSLLQPDVVLQIGSRITSKRISSFLTSSPLNAYILVEDHPHRHDPFHCLTHRIQSSVLSFSCIKRLLHSLSYLPAPTLIEYKKTLLFFSEAAGRQISRVLSDDSNLSEPLVARIVASSIPPGGALFLGNSMAIRDTDMYGPTHTVYHRGPQSRSQYRPSSNVVYQEDEDEYFRLLDRDDSYDEEWDKDKEWDEEGKGDMDSCATQFGNLTEKIDINFDLIGPRVTSNRGASGIDGVLSTAIGFAAGSQRSVTLLVGDLSFLHDTNGLSLLKERPNQPPVVIVIVNNRGGGIFSLLPVKKTLPEPLFTKLFSTPHDVEIKDLCRAHRIIHNLATSKADLKKALTTAWKSKKHTIIEVKTDITSNVSDHGYLQKSVKECMSRTLKILLSTENSSLKSSPFSPLVIANITYRKFSIDLTSPTTIKNGNSTKREGFILQITLSSGSIGLGEISPLSGLHSESLQDAEEQILFLISVLKNVPVPLNMALLDGSFHSWMTKHLSIDEHDLHPSVKCGLEISILSAMANTFGKSLSEFLIGADTRINSSLEDSTPLKCSTSKKFVPICALLDCVGSPDEVADEALSYVKMGFNTLKIKVGRRECVDDEVAMIHAVRSRIGYEVKIRVDANRSWSLPDAKKFCLGVQSCDLEFIEEPLRNPSEITNLSFFCKIPFAWDESFVEVFLESRMNRLNLLNLNGLRAIVIKPSVVGGFENAKRIQSWAQKNEMRSIISSSFESSIGLFAFAEFAHYIDTTCSTSLTEMATKSDISTSSNNVIRPSDSNSPSTLSSIPTSEFAHDLNKTSNSDSRPVLNVHGLGTYSWLREDTISQNKFAVERFEEKCEMGVDLKLSKTVLSEPQFNYSNVSEKQCNVKADIYFRKIKIRNSVIQFCIKETCYEKKGPEVDGSKTNQSNGSNRSPVIFLHGFLGEKDDFSHIISSLSLSFRCLSIDLPGHGQTRVQTFESDSQLNFGLNLKENDSFSPEVMDTIERANKNGLNPNLLMQRENGGVFDAEDDVWQEACDLTFEDVADSIGELLHEIIPDRCFVVGYSMGARLALYLSLKFPDKVISTALISGTPGIEGEGPRSARAARDDALSRTLRVSSLKTFVQSWYSQKMWESFRKCSSFQQMFEKRIEGGNKFGLAKSLSCMSVGKQTSLWNKIKDCKAHLLLVVGSEDEKFVKIANKMYEKWKGEEKKENPNNVINSVLTNASTTPDLFADRIGVIPFIGSYFNDEDYLDEGDETMTFEKFYANEMRKLNLLDMEIEKREESKKSVPRKEKQEKQEKPMTELQQIEVFEVQGAGHAVHLEKPLAVITHIRNYFSRLT